MHKYSKYTLYIYCSYYDFMIFKYALAINQYEYNN
jgi:hypothetical protein